MYKSPILKNVLFQNPSKNVKVCGITFNTKNIDPTIVKGIHAIPAAIIALTILNEATFPIGPIKYFSKNANTLFSDSIKRPLFYVNSYHFQIFSIVYCANLCLLLYCLI